MSNSPPSESCDPRDFPLCGKPSNDLVSRYMHALTRCFASWLPAHSEKYAIGKFRLSSDDMVEIIGRVEKRRIYFHIFHNGMKMGELNELALYCFWILKLNPFSCCSFATNGEKNSEASGKINAIAALYLFCKTLAFYANTREMKCNIDEKAVQSIYYAFRYRDLSKEAIMLLAESYIVPK